MGRRKVTELLMAIADNQEALAPAEGYSDQENLYRTGVYDGLLMAQMIVRMIYRLEDGIDERETKPKSCS